MRVKVTCQKATAPQGYHASFERYGLGGVGGCGTFWSEMDAATLNTFRCPKCGLYEWAGANYDLLRVGRIGKGGCDASCRASYSTKCACSCAGVHHGELLNNGAEMIQGK